MSAARIDIEGAKGELTPYSLERLPKADCLARYRITRLDTLATYYVYQHPSWGWACTCDAWEHRNARGRKQHRGTCKHCVEVSRTHNLVAALAAEPEKEP